MAKIQCSWEGDDLLFKDGATEIGRITAVRGLEFKIGPTVTINYNDSSPVAICDVADGDLIESIFVEIVTAFDDTGPQTIDIGDGNDTDRLLPSASIDVGNTGYYGNMVVGYIYSGSDTIDAVIGAGNSDGTQGQAIVYVKVKNIGG